jgi:hypothetical protein
MTIYNDCACWGLPSISGARIVNKQVNYFIEDQLSEERMFVSNRRLLLESLKNVIIAVELALESITLLVQDTPLAGPGSLAMRREAC